MLLTSVLTCVAFVAQAHAICLQLGAFSQRDRAEKFSQSIRDQFHYNPVINTRKTAAKIFYLVQLQDVERLDEVEKNLENHGIHSVKRSLRIENDYTQTPVATPVAERVSIAAHVHPVEKSDRWYHETLPLAHTIDNDIYGDVSAQPIAPGQADMPHKEATPTLDRLLKLQDAIFLALRFNPDVLNKEIDRISDKYDVRVQENQFEWRYSLTGSGNVSRSKSSGVVSPTSESYQLVPVAKTKNHIGTQFSVGLTNIYDGTHYNPAMTLEISQPLLRGAGKEVVNKSLNDQYDQERIRRLAMKKQITSAVNRVITDYFSLVSVNNKLFITQESLVEAEKEFHNNAIQIQLGRLPRTVNITQQSQIESLKLSVVQAKNAISQAKQTLLTDIGLNPDLDIRVPRDVVIENFSRPNLEITIDYAMKNNLDYQANLLGYKLDKRNLVKAKNDMLPQLDLTARAVRGGGFGGGANAGLQSLVNDQNHSESLGISLDVPIDNVSLHAGLARAEIAIQHDQINLSDQRRRLITQVKNAIRDLDSERVQIEISKQSVAIKQQDYDLERKKLQLGQSTALDVSNKQNSLLSAQSQLIDNKIDYLNRVTALREILGTTLATWGIELRY